MREETKNMEFFSGERGKITFFTKFFRGKPIFFGEDPYFLNAILWNTSRVRISIAIAHSYNFALHCYLNNRWVD